MKRETLIIPFRNTNMLLVEDSYRMREEGYRDDQTLLYTGPDVALAKAAVRTTPLAAEFCMVVNPSHYCLIGTRSAEDTRALREKVRQLRDAAPHPERPSA